MVQFSRGRARGNYNRYPRTGYHGGHNSWKQIHIPRHLAEEFKRTGAFDEIKRDLLESFNASPEGKERFLQDLQSHLEDKLQQDPRIRHRTYRGRKGGLFPLGGRNAGHEELLREVNRTTLMDDVLTSLKSRLSEPERSDQIRIRLMQVLQRNREQVARRKPTRPPNLTQRPSVVAQAAPAPETLILETVERESLSGNSDSEDDISESQRPPANNAGVSAAAEKLENAEETPL
ncbi:hypothetical protein BT69DRAFT_124543 [Atractiella rhizophila]|nr:hypothetical protein BT69DRAFT_124543 [Atractiella rhizophila]